MQDIFESLGPFDDTGYRQTTKLYLNGSQNFEEKVWEIFDYVPADSISIVKLKDNQIVCLVLNLELTAPKILENKNRTGVEKKNEVSQLIYRVL